MTTPENSPTNAKTPDNPQKTSTTENTHPEGAITTSAAAENAPNEAVTTTSATTSTPVPQLSSRQTTTVIALLSISAFVVILNETILSVALPRLMADLNIPAATAQWLTTAFMLTMSVVIPTTGFIIQRFSTRKVFAAALGLFLTGTILAACAPGFAVLLIARVIQASGTALVLPLLMTTVLAFVPVARRGAVLGIISVVIAVAPAVGPTISGIILSFTTWRWLFLFMVPIVVVDLVIGMWKIKSLGETTNNKLDVASIFLSAIGFGGIVYGLSSFGESDGSVKVPGVVALVIGAIGVFIFSRRQIRLARKDAALLNLSPFKLRQFCLAIGGISVSMGAMMGVVLVLPIYLQDVNGESTLHTGLAMLPGGLLMGLFGPVIGSIFDKVGARPLVLPGTVMALVSAFLMMRLGVGAPIWQAVLLDSILCFGFSLVFTPLFTVGLGDLDPVLYSHGSAILNTLQQLGGAAGTAVLVAVMSVASASASGSSAQVLQVGTSAAFGGAGIFMVIVLVLMLFVRSTDGRSQAEAGEANAE